jgi:hypothetical protein
MKWEKRFEDGTYNEQRELCEQKFKELFGDAKFSAVVTDPDFYDILNHFIFGELQSNNPNCYKNQICMSIARNSKEPPN